MPTGNQIFCTIFPFATILVRSWLQAGGKSVVYQGLIDDTGTSGKTRVLKSLILERMLSLIAQFAPPLLRNDIIKNSTSLSWIWERIRKYYAFGSSEVNFIKLYEIQRKDGERYETLYQRILAHLEDNLITVSSGIEHDGVVATVDEVLSPTAERLAVFHWLTLIDQRLPAYVARPYAQDLQSRSLKDIQPRISENMDAILADINSQEAVAVQYTQSQGRKKSSHSISLIKDIKHRTTPKRIWLIKHLVIQKDLVLFVTQLEDHLLVMISANAGSLVSSTK